MRNDAWNAVESRNAQIVFLVESAQTECDSALDGRTSVDVFQLLVPRVDEILAHQVYHLVRKMRLVPSLWTMIPVAVMSTKGPYESAMIPYFITKF